MKIGELSKRTGIPARMLRYYEDQGLITPQRLDNGYRDYDEGLVARAEKIRCFIDAGVPTRLISMMLQRLEHPQKDAGTGATPQLRAMLVREHDRITERIDSLDRTRASLAALIETM
ncbi:MerR family transcriptional regulator [Actinoplanes sp. OR16]|uniref:MerR family transcriptional regulator n=1 Tax=Actinoplanes sp. OR16 TaxID=946334 RepID=UPI000F6DE263|nr:MerR family transcriptional regulator [Actinoplanes sp. OR16]BBH63864.1 MerR family transcriptional regulator [Actinoplanes sp. OR16]